MKKLFRMLNWREATRLFILGMIGVLAAFGLYFWILIFVFLSKP